MNGIVPVSAYAGGRYPTLAAARRQRATDLGAVGIVDTRYELDAHRLPRWIRDEIISRGCRAERIGSTTYRSSTWVLVPIGK